MLILIFLEFSIAGLAVFGGLMIFRKFLEERKLEFLYVTLIFFVAAISDSGAFLSQLLFNLGLEIAPIGYQILLYSTVVIALLTWFYIAEVFKIKARYLTVLLTLTALYFIFLTYHARIGLIYEGEIIAPVIPYFVGLPLGAFFITITLVGALGFFGLIGKFPEARDRGTLKILGMAGLSAATIFIFVLIFLFTRQAIFFILAWAGVFASSLFIFLGNVIPEGSKLIANPLGFFRSKIIYKLILAFSFLIIIALAGTSLVMVNISKTALSTSVIGNYKILARSVAKEIAYALREKHDLEEVRRIVLATKVGRNGLAYLVDKDGRIVIHPDTWRVGENVAQITVVKKVISRLSGGEEFEEVKKVKVVGAYAPVEAFPFGIIVEEPVAEAYGELRKMETYSLLFVILGIILATWRGTVFARTLEKPIQKLISGTKIIRAGNLETQVIIESIDEIGELAEAFNEMAFELKESQEHLVRAEKLSALGIMAAGMAHEIKNALIPLKTLARLLKTEKGAELQKKLAEMAPGEIDRIEKIARDLSQFSRPSKPHFELVQVNEVADKAVELMGIVAKKSNVQIIKHFGSLPRIEADPDRLEQVFMNLILNSIEAMSDGGEILIETRAGVSGKLGVEEIPVIFIDFYDTGTGISEENMEKLFVPFFSTKEGGTGMGLPIIHRVIEDHKGHIEIKSEVGKGTTILIILPQRQVL